MPLDKMGNEYTPMTEAEKAAHRARPFPPEFMRQSEALRRRAAQVAAEPVKVYRAHPEDTRAEPESLAKAIKRNVGRKVRRG